MHATTSLLQTHGVDPRMVVLRTAMSIFSGTYWDRRPHLKAYGNDAAACMFDHFRHEMPEDLRALDADEGVLTPAFRRLVLGWACARLANVERTLIALPRGRTGVKVARILRTPLAKFDDARRTGATTLGVHWTFAPESWDMYPVWAGDNPGVDVFVHAEVEDAHIDWFATALSHMDYLSGDEEYEVRITPGAPVHVVSIEDENGQRLDALDGIAFTA